MAEDGGQEHEPWDYNTGKKDMMDKWLVPLKEDLASWISRLLDIENLTTETLPQVLDTGVVLCRLANYIQTTGEEFFVRNPKCDRAGVFPPCGVTYKQRGALHGSFVARDNVSNFIRWCRELRVPEVIMFETEDLVLNKNEKSVLLTLLEVARKAFKFGVDPPELVRLENEIDKELEQDPEPIPEPVAEPQPRIEEVTVLKKKHKSHSLDDLVYEVLEKCTCPTKYSVQRIADGKYRMGDNKNLIFVRVMRKHVMVRVGGGWDTLDRYFAKHDPCRLTESRHRRLSKVTRQQSIEPVARSPSSMSITSLSSSEDSAGMSIASTPPQLHKDNCPRQRSLSSGRSLSPCTPKGSPSRRGNKTQANRSTPPRTIETISRQSRRSRSMQDLHQGLTATAPADIYPSTSRASSAKRSTSATRYDGAKSAPVTPGQRRRSVAVTPRRDGTAATPAQANQRRATTTRSGPPKTMETQGRLHSRSRSMQDLNGYGKGSSADAQGRSRSTSTRPSSARARPNTTTTDNSRGVSSKSEPRRQSLASSPRRPSTAPAGSPKPARRQSSAASFASTTFNSSAGQRRASSATRTSTLSPAGSPRITRKQGSSPDKASQSPRTKSTQPSPLADTFTRSRSASSFEYRSRSSSGHRQRASTVETPRKVKGTTDIPASPQRKLSTPLSSPTKSKIPMMIPSKKAATKRTESPKRQAQKHQETHSNEEQLEDRLAIRVSKGETNRSNDSTNLLHLPEETSNGLGSYNSNDGNFRTPFDDYSYTSEDTASIFSESVSESDSQATFDQQFLPVSPDLNLDLVGSSRLSKSSSGETTPSDFRTISSRDTESREYDFLDVESERSMRSVSSDFSPVSSPSRELWEMGEKTPTRSDLRMADANGEGSGGKSLIERLKSLNVQQSSISPMIRGRIFAHDATDGQDKPSRGSSSPKAEPAFSSVEHSTKDPEERSKFFDIEKEMGAESVIPGSPRKFSLVQSLIGSIEKRKKSDPQPPIRKGLEGTGLVKKPTEPRAGNEAVTESRSVQDGSVPVSAPPPHDDQEVILLEARAEYDAQKPGLEVNGRLVDENKNIKEKIPADKGRIQTPCPCEDNMCEEEQLKRFEEDERSFNAHEANPENGHENEDDDCLDSSGGRRKPEISPRDLEVYPRVHRQFSLEEMIEDMLPGNSTNDKKEGIRPHFQAFI